MSSFFDAASLILGAGAVLYYEGWLFTWLLRRQYATHFCEIGAPRETFFVIGAWSLNWYPFYILFFAETVLLFLIGDLERSDLIEASLSALVILIGFFLFHRVTFIRARKVFLGSANEAFAFFPAVEDLQMSCEVADDTRKQLPMILRDGGYRVLSIDRSQLILFSPTAGKEENSMSIIVLPVGQVVAMRVNGVSQFSDFGPGSLVGQLFPGIARWLPRRLR